MERRCCAGRLWPHGRHGTLLNNKYIYNINGKIKKLAGIIYIALIALILIPFDKFGFRLSQHLWRCCSVWFLHSFSPTLILNSTRRLRSIFFRCMVVCLGFNTMNLQESLRSGSEGMMFTVVSVVGVMALWVLLGYWLHINRKTAYLISSGTAICGGSAIAAVGPVVKANENEMAVSLGVIFILNSIALFIFPPLGHILDMSQAQFGTWAAIAIHDTSSVVGAGENLRSGGSADRDSYKTDACAVDYTSGYSHNVHFPRQDIQNLYSVVHLSFLFWPWW